MQFRLRPFTAADARSVDRWRYPAPYDFYDLRADPGDREAFLDPGTWPNRYFAVEDEAEALVGFFQFDQQGPVVRLGLGMRPELTGAGHGQSFVRAGLEYAWERWGPDQFEVEVAAFNDRARTVYERVGFEAAERYEQETNGERYEFLRMRRPASGGGHAEAESASD
jgi:ribosomal-protein-alanine N-acetyltransferase